MSATDDLRIIEEGLLALHRASFQPKSWTALQHMAGVDLDRADVALLKAVLHCPREPCRMQDIAQYLGIEAPSVTRKVQDLESRGLLSRAADTQDKRATVVQITPTGMDFIRKIQQARMRQLADAMHSWSDTDRSEFARLFNKLATDLRRK